MVKVTRGGPMTAAFSQQRPQIVVESGQEREDSCAASSTRRVIVGRGLHPDVRLVQYLSYAGRRAAVRGRPGCGPSLQARQLCPQDPPERDPKRESERPLTTGVSRILMRRDLRPKDLVTLAGRFVAWPPTWRVPPLRCLRRLLRGTFVAQRQPDPLTSCEIPAHCRSVEVATCVG